MADQNQAKKEPTLQEKIEREILNKTTTQKPPAPPRGPLKSLRTFQGDIEEALGKTGGSIASVVVAEQERKKEEKVAQKAKEKEEVPQPKPETKQEPENPVLSALPKQESTDTFVYNIPPKPEESHFSEIKNKFFFSFGLFLLVLGIVVVGGIYFIKTRDVAIVENRYMTLVDYSREENFNMASSSRKDLLAKIVELKQAELPENSVTYLKIDNTGDSPAKQKDALKFLAPRIPSELVRSFENEYMVGIYSSESNEPFIIFSENDFGLSYSGMLEWEKNIISDLGEIFSLETKDSVFEDEALKNKDLRVIRDKNGKVVFLYSFVDKNTVLMTSNESIFGIILGKFVTNKMSR